MNRHVIFITILIKRIRIKSIGHHYTSWVSCSCIARHLNVGTKIQAFGDRESQTAAGAGLEVGTLGFAYRMWNVQIPLFFSVHPTEKFSWYLSPRYIYPFVASTGDIIGNVKILRRK